MQKFIKILSIYTIIFGIYVAIINFFIIGKDVRLTPEQFFLALLAILPIITFAISVLIYLKK